MYTCRFVWFVSVLCLLASSASAQTTLTSSSGTASDPQAVALIQKALAALTGGLPVTDVTLTGSARRITGSDDETGTGTLKADSTQDSLVDLKLPSGTWVEIRNHSAVPLPGAVPAAPNVPASITQAAQPTGAWLGPDGIRHAMVSHNVLTDAAWFFPALMLRNLVGGNYVLSYIGQETSGVQTVLHVSGSQRLTAPTGLPAGVSEQLTNLHGHVTQMDIFLDATTSLPVALAFNTHPDGNALLDIPVQVQFSNYQPTSGVEVPLHVRKWLNSTLVLDLQFTSTSVNSGVPASTFALQ
jgi:hypothetical protein